MADEEQKHPHNQPRTFMQKLSLFLPLIIFGSLAIFFLLQLTSGRNAQDLPSVLIGKQAPSLSMAAIEGSGVPALNDAAISGKVTLVNVWASWCVPCRQEHPFLLELSKDPRIQIVGLNYKDKNENALKFLTELGNPYTAIGIDPNGAASIDWGVYGVPETFLISRSGEILYKHIGPIDARGFEAKVLPAIEAALK